MCILLINIEQKGTLFVPTISIFYGILIQMFWDDHAPPHFHALYAEYETLIDIKTLEVIRGNMPKRALALVLEWASEHRQELIEDWKLCEKNQLPKKIPPLQ
jgi:hypothetical protein